jgi:hypothetical protein
MDWLDSRNFSFSTFDNSPLNMEDPSVWSRTANMVRPDYLNRLDLFRTLNDSGIYYGIDEFNFNWDLTMANANREFQPEYGEDVDVPESLPIGLGEGAGMMGAVAAAGASAIASHQATVDTNKDVTGQGLAGDSFGSAFQAREDASHDQTVGIENAALVAGSAFLGPEALAVGMIGAGINSAFNDAPEASVQSNLGTDVPVSNLA